MKNEFSAKQEQESLNRLLAAHQETVRAEVNREESRAIGALPMSEKEEEEEILDALEEDADEDEDSLVGLGDAAVKVAINSGDSIRAGSNKGKTGPQMDENVSL